MKSFYGFKKDSSQIFDVDGRRLAITKIAVKPLIVIGKKTETKVNYQAIQVGIGQCKKLTKPITGILKGLKIKPRFIRELKVTDVENYKKGDSLQVSKVFQSGDKVKVRGITKGKGFAGVMKRWGFAGGPRTHGQSDRQRAPGSIGQGTDPGRVWKGKKMPGHMGNKTHTVLGLQVVKVDDEHNELWITGLVPGRRGGLLEITKTSQGKFAGLLKDKTQIKQEIKKGNQKKIKKEEKNSQKVEKVDKEKGNDKN